MTFLHSHTHSDTILGSLLGFISANNLCFCRHSRWIHASSINCNLPPGHFVWIFTNALARTPTGVHAQTHLCGEQHLPGMAKTPLLPFVMCYCRCCHQFMTPLCLSILPVCCVRSFIHISITFSLVAGLGCSFNVYVYSDVPPSFAARPHLF